MEKPKTYAAITEEQKAAWTAQYGKLKEIEVAAGDADEPTGEVHSFVLKKLNRSELMAVASYADKKDLERANKSMISFAVLGGDMESLEKDDDTYFAVIEAIGDMIGKKKAVLKKR